MAKNNSRALELTIISAEDLSLSGRHPVKKNTYVIIKTESNNNQITTMDTENTSFPSWNQNFLVNMPMHVKFFTLEVRCRNFSGDHLVGSARVPTSDFIGGYFPTNYLHFLSYRLRDRYGDRNGIINLSVKMKSSSNSGMSSSIPASCSSTATGWNYRAGGGKGQNVSHGVVVGVPVRNSY